MVDFARQGQMTDACVVPRQALSNTVVGMAHFAGSGPEGSTCGGCDYWQTPPGKKIMICDKYRQMTGDKAKAIPASTHACRHLRREAEVTRLTHDEMAHELSKLAYGKADWLGRFSDGRNRRGDHEIELKRRELAVLTQAKEDYEKAAQRAA